MAKATEIEFIFEPQEEGGYYVYAPNLPGLHTQGETLEEANANAREALELYVEGVQEEGRPLGAGVIRQKLRVPVWAAGCRSSPARSSSAHWSGSVADRAATGQPRALTTSRALDLSCRSAAP